MGRYVSANGWMLVVGGWLLACTSLGCMTPTQRADRAYENEEWPRALKEYKEVFEQKKRDEISPETYARAARVATREGNFSLAERYYSRGLRNGGDSSMVREFAEFYLKTSKYQKASRLLRNLLNSNLPKQPIYNNLGTALMYSGAPLDAESYLLVAQQMKPSDPYPYVNLGLLYDRHLNHPALALGFYRCFRRMAPEAREQRAVSNRIKELKVRLSNDRPAIDVACGQPYQPSSARNARAGQLDLGGEDEADEDGETEKRSKGLSATDGGKVYDLSTLEPVEQSEPSGESEPSGQAESPRPSEEKGRETDGETNNGGVNEDKTEETEDEPGAVTRARKAYSKEEYRDVVESMADVTMSEMGPEAMGMYGIALGELGRNEEAVQWLEWVVERKPTPRRVEMLVTVYRRLNRPDDADEVCADFREKEAYQGSLSNCPNSRSRDKEILDKAGKDGEVPADAVE